jgi:hypothetical protein
VQANKAITSQKPPGACTVDSATLEALIAKLENAHYEELQQRGDDWEPEVKVRVSNCKTKKSSLNI